MESILTELNTYTEETPFFSLENEIYLAKIVEVYDGDTVYAVFKYGGAFHKFKIRMNGYDSPEMRPRKNKFETEEERQKEIQKAVAARDRLRQLVLNKNVLVICGKFDDFGRILGILTFDISSPKTVNDIMVEEGLGIKLSN